MPIRRRHVNPGTEFQGVYGYGSRDILVSLTGPYPQRVDPTSL
ncbi:uncharacterized protein G2W53_019878 [Senna tora]|uniref:Uncharacterized protein n=1 Tax=Senna tora TaxID=362788 RepID=A0A834TVQ5_9FABA|nr:uncharacterized protein G2W53_019878 [Senna tora]